jgi:hypothetical protein
MNYGDLVRLYFDRLVALQWYWTIYVLVIGGVLAFSNFRQRPELVTTILVTVLYACFAYKNLGAIEATLAERNALVKAIKESPASPDDKRARELLEPTVQPQEYDGVRNFHVACDLMTIVVLWVKESRRRKTELASGPGTA